MTIQTNAEPAAAEATSDALPDAWDRLAALAFDGAAAHGGCSAQAHACTCRAEHASHEPHASHDADPAGETGA